MKTVKKTQRCVKCQGQRLWVIERFRIPGEYLGGVELPVVVNQEEPAKFFAMSRAMPQGSFELWVCEACGYSEFWAKGLSGLRENPEAGVRLVDTTPQPSGPFR